MESGSITLFTKMDMIIAFIASFLAYIFGDHYILFVIYIALNIADWLTRWIAARATKTENSSKAGHGFVKKVGYWILIAVSFVITAVFIEVGNIIGIDLGVTVMLGWFVLIGLMLNEVRSIIENLVDIPGFYVPKILTKGLEVADKTFEKAADAAIPDIRSDDDT